MVLQGLVFPTERHLLQFRCVSVVLDDGALPEEDHLHGIHTTRKSSGEALRYPESINPAAGFHKTSNLLVSSGILSLAPSPEAPSLSLLFSLLLGLPIALWSYKCLMMVLFQRKIIYMGYIPPGSRQEKLSDIPNLSTLQRTYCLEEIRIQSSDKVKLSALVMSKKNAAEPNCVVLYLQGDFSNSSNSPSFDHHWTTAGNAGNPLHRIPVFTSLLSSTTQINPVILAPAPRSYWSSTKRTPTQGGLLADYASALRYAVKRWHGVPIVLYGHSLGGAVPVCLLASLDSDLREEQDYRELRSALRGMILENPFASIPDMVRALYPQSWLPYHYLAPLARDKWDALSAMRDSARVSASSSEASSSLPAGEDDSRHHSILPKLARNMLVLVSSHDEVVPPSMGRAIFDARPAGARNARDGGHGEDRSRLVEIDGALHEDAWRQLQWRKETGRYLEDVVRMGRR
ncbi:hypothetical protein A7U60_g3294 [Sanghuangporus baumii]|uniref:Uncharacterized protein n=1 Tax=Sanghuangporus baumii TaxID=108892 RepID=A0A9Q5I0Q2_SANBA|nr:hypothetical protein A7U60_g3294 [Sanghuangporus baumii]